MRSNTYATPDIDIGITSIDIRGQDGIPIKEKWDTEGVRSYLGVAAATYPNMFWMYGPQSPSAFSNGPSSIVRRLSWCLCLIHFGSLDG